MTVFRVGPQRPIDIRPVQCSSVLARDNLNDREGEPTYWSSWSHIDKGPL